MGSRRTARALKNQRGSVMVESAVLLPLVVMLMIGVIDLALMFRDYIYLSEIVREVALKGSTLQRLVGAGNAPGFCTTEPTVNDMQYCLNVLDNGGFNCNLDTTGGAEPRDECYCGYVVLCWHAFELLKTRTSFDPQTVMFQTQLEPDTVEQDLCKLKVTVNAPTNLVFRLFSSSGVANFTISTKYNYVGAPLAAAGCGSPF